MVGEGFREKKKKKKKKKKITVKRNGWAVRQEGGNNVNSHGLAPRG